MSAVTTLSRLRDGVHLARDVSNQAMLLAWPHAEELGRLDEAQYRTIRALSTDQPAERLDQDLLDRLRAGGWLVDTVREDDRDLFDVRPLGPRRKNEPAEPLRLSRFAALRRDEDDYLVDSPLATGVIRLHDHRLVASVALTARLREGTAADRALLDHLGACGLLATAAEADELSHAQWSHHELAFHRGSRLRGDLPLGQPGFGGGYWAKGIFDPPPGRHPRWPARGLRLPRPDLAQLRRDDPSLSSVMEDRRSVRAYDETPVTLDELGELLFRTARVRFVGEDEGLDVSDRPYPGGGAVYELELYPLVHRVRGLAPGLYYHDPHDHLLVPVPATATSRRWLMRSAVSGMAGDATPDVLIVMASRFGRLAWKYRAIGYALTLKHVGVLQQSMYLAATAMGLAPCALGVGDSDAFAAATGLDPLEETSVGEFALGRPAGERAG
ncbi:SagB/ThcOx family dehydrogenase [Nonomuraea sp. MG754425]|uniref:SagB/ThcOx family dehydrogenase n=1 Tax=Nonomuraea sp. MG754425 TaxID=2570319 RepID=UPI001F01CBC5|nr:SagB family peptide dehydrogenase [Nonomuraea sp. MG754425]MCF6471839.1 SagB/ThcOx family dehydrogenase [Nonomuraea sp. MG754425]